MLPENLISLIRDFLSPSGVSHSRSLPNKTVCSAAVVPVVWVCRFEKTVEVSASLCRFLKSSLISPLFSSISGAVIFSAVIIMISLLVFEDNASGPLAK